MGTGTPLGVGGGVPEHAERPSEPDQVKAWHRSARAALEPEQ